MESVLITGASGFIGSFIVEEALKRRFGVWAGIRSTSSKKYLKNRKIHFQQREVKDLSHPKKYGFIITNPPYGERLEEKEALPKLYKEFGDAFKNLDSWSAYMITSYEEAERYFGRKADKNRKIYNGMLRTYFYQFQGPRPPRKTVREQGMAL